MSTPAEPRQPGSAASYQAPDTGADGDSPPIQTRNGGDVFDRIRRYGAYRPDECRWLAGVATGLAQRWQVDPILVRGVFVALFFAGVGPLLYGIGWLLMPQQDGTIHAERALHGHFTGGMLGGAFLVLAAGSSLFFGTNVGDRNGEAWIPFALIVGGLLWLRHRRRSRRPGSSGESWSAGASWSGSDGDHRAPYGPPYGTATYEPPTQSNGGSPHYGVPNYGTPEPGQYPTSQNYSTSPTYATYQNYSTSQSYPSADHSPHQYGPYPGQDDGSCARSSRRPGRAFTMITLGAALLSGAAASLVTSAGAVIAATALAVVGLGLVISGLRGRRGGLLTPIGILLAVAVLVSGSSVPQPSESFVGELQWKPTSAAEAQNGVSLGMGSAVADLRDPRLLAEATPANPLVVDLRLGMGEVTVVVPAEVSTRIDYQFGMGGMSNRLTGHTAGGIGLEDKTTTGTGEPRLIVRVHQGMGSIVVDDELPASDGLSDQSDPTDTDEPTDKSDQGDRSTTAGAQP